LGDFFFYSFYCLNSFHFIKRSKDSSLNKDFETNPNEAYEFANEFKTQTELDEIIAEPDDMRMQALLIRERILGPTHPDTTYYIRYRYILFSLFVSIPYFLSLI
jgi:hypothetical protein